MSLRTFPATLAAVAAAALACTPSGAATLETNLQIQLHERAAFDARIDRTLSVDPALLAQRLLNPRLGVWQGTQLDLSLTQRLWVAIDDPGLSEPPGSDRGLLQVTAPLALGGTLAGGELARDFAVRYFCPGTVAVCSAQAVAAEAPVIARRLVITDPAALGGGLAVQAAVPATDILFPGAALRLGPPPPLPGVPLGHSLSFHELQGSVTLRSQFTEKSVSAYAADALAATAGPPFDAARLGRAHDDVAALRSASLSSLPPSLGQAVADAPALSLAQTTLAAARDARRAAEAAESFASGFLLVRDLWDTVAQADPSLGRGSAGVVPESGFFARAADEVAAVRAGLLADGDGSFAAMLGDVVVGGAAPVLQLDGAAFGLTGALLQVYLSPESPDGQFVLDLQAAGRHALLRGFYDQITLLDGPASGIRLSDDGGLSATLGVDDGGLYIGERQNGLLWLENPQGGATVALNNFYSPDWLVVASFDVSPVPELPTAWLLAGGVLGLAWRRRRH